MPLSWTAKVTVPSRASARRRISLRSPEYLKALSSRFKRAVTMAAASAGMAGRPAAAWASNWQPAARNRSRTAEAALSTMAEGEVEAKSKAYLFLSMREKARKLSIKRLRRRFSWAINWRYWRAVSSWSLGAFKRVSTRRRMEERGVLSSWVTLARRSLRRRGTADCLRMSRTARKASAATRW